jgi:hypothetical protein
VTNVRCCDKTCGVLFGMPDHVYDQAKEKGKDRPFYCPNGHQQWFSEDEGDRQRRRAEEAERRAKSLSEFYDRERKTRIYWQGRAHRKPKAKANG